MATVKVVLERNRPPYPEVVVAYEADGYTIEPYGAHGAMLHITKKNVRIATFTEFSHVEVEQEKDEALPPSALVYEKPRVTPAAA